MQNKSHSLLISGVVTKKRVKRIDESTGEKTKLIGYFCQSTYTPVYRK